MKYLYSNLTDKIIGAAINVHKELGPGYPEKIYQRALAKEFGRQRIPYEREREFKIHYLDEEVGCADSGRRARNNAAGAKR